MDACLSALQAGEVVAVKGIGGYHLLCDATSHDAITRLRRRKNRPAKPLAVMMSESLAQEIATATSLTAGSLKGQFRRDRKCEAFVTF